MALLATAGCFGLAPAEHAEPAPRLWAGDGEAWGSKPLRWSDDGARGPVTVHLEMPAGFWETHGGALEFSFDVPNATRDAPPDALAGSAGSDWHQFELQVTLPDGTFLREASSIGGGVILVERARSGTYEIRIERIHGDDSYEAAVQLDTWPLDQGPPADLLPNLVTIAPVDLRIGEVDTRFHLPCVPGPCLVPRSIPPVQSAAGIRGCDLFEATEGGARRCLRFGNGVGNAGPGAFEIHLVAGEGARSGAGDGRWAQRVFRSDGSSYDLPAGEARFHEAHLHFHYEDITRFELFEHDLASGARGERVGEGRKTGFCFSDQHLLALGLPRTHAIRYLTDGCLSWDAGSLGGDWWSGLGSNWFDRYEWYYPDQHVEISGLPDGVYELVSTVNADRSILESSYDDNVAGAVFRLVGDEVEVLRSYGSAPQAPPGVRI